MPLFSHYSSILQEFFKPDGTCSCADERLTFAEIRERANLPEDDLVRILHSLSCLKYKILAKDPPGKTPGKNDTFSMNAAFTERLRRIKVRTCHPLLVQPCPLRLQSPSARALKRRRSVTGISAAAVLHAQADVCPALEQAVWDVFILRWHIACLN